MYSVQWFSVYGGWHWEEEEAEGRKIIQGVGRKSWLNRRHKNRSAISSRVPKKCTLKQ